jgi:hypothetical protein
MQDEEVFFMVEYFVIVKKMFSIAVTYPYFLQTSPHISMYA